MKVHFAATEGTHSVVQTHTFPQLFDIKEDVKESYELCGSVKAFDTLKKGGLIHARYAEASAISVEKP